MRGYYQVGPHGAGDRRPVRPAPSVPDRDRAGVYPGLSQGRAAAGLRPGVATSDRRDPADAPPVRGPDADRRRAVLPARRPAQPRSLAGHGPYRGPAQQGLRCLDDRRRDDRARLPPRQLPRAERAGPLGAGRDHRGGAGQRGEPDGTADRADHQRPRRRGPDPPPRRDRAAAGPSPRANRAADPRGGRDARERRPAPSADRPRQPRPRESFRGFARSWPASS